MKRSVQRTLGVLSGVIAGLLLASCGVPPRPGTDALRSAAEVEGLLTGYAVQQLGGRYPDGPLTEFVNGIGAQLAAVCQSAEGSRRWHIVNDAHGDFHRLPTGDVLFGAEQLLAVDSEAQLAALLAYGLHGAAGNAQPPGDPLGRLARLPDSPEGRLRIAETAHRLLKQRPRTSLSEADLEATAVCLRRAGYPDTGIGSLPRLFAFAVDVAADMSEDRPGAETGCPSPGAGETSRSAFLQGRAECRAYRFFRRARALERAGRFAEALETYHQAMREAPGQAFWLSELGTAYLRREDPVPARRYLHRALRIDAGYYQTHLGLGYLFVRDQRWEDAAAALERSLDLLPTLQGTFLLAEAEQHRDHAARAAQLYRAVRSRAPDTRLGRAAADRLTGY